MPLYMLRCTGCKATLDHFGHMEDEWPECIVCGGTFETDWSRRGPPKIQRNWHGNEQVSTSLGLHTDQVGAFTAECPSWKFDVEGNAIFDNDAHMRKCLKEQQSYDAREREKLQESQRQVAEAVERGDLDYVPVDRTDIPPVS